MNNVTVPFDRRESKTVAYESNKIELKLRGSTFADILKKQGVVGPLTLTITELLHLRDLIDEAIKAGDL